MSPLFIRFRDRFAVGEGPALLFLAFTSVLLFAPFLFGGAMLGTDEAIGAHYQYALFYSNAIEHGESFLWNPYSFTGFPSYVTGFGTYLSPFTYLGFYLLSPFFALYTLITLVIFGGFTCAYLLARTWSLSRGGALLVALVYGTSQMFQMELPFSTAHTFFVLPLILLALSKAAQANSRKMFITYTFLGGLGVGLGFLAAYLQIFIYELVIIGCFALFLEWRNFKNPPLFRGQSIAALTCMVIVGLILGAPQVIALKAYAPFTSRTAHYAAEIIPQSGIQLADAVSFFVPHSIQVPAGSYTSPFYFGLAGLFLFLIAVLCVRSYAVFFLTVLYALLLATAANMPVFSWLSTHIPPFNRIGAIQRWLLPGALLPALLAGYGFDYFSAVRESPAARRFLRYFTWSTFLGIFLLVSSYFVLTFLISSDRIKQWLFFRTLAHSGRTLESLQHPESYYFEVMNRMFAFVQHAVSLANPWFLSFVVVTLASVAALHFYVRSPRSPLAKAVLLATVFGALCISYGGETIPSLVPRAKYFNEVPPAAQLMQEHAKSFDDNRYILIGGELLGRALAGQVGDPPTVPQSAFAMRDLLLHEAGTAYGLAAIDGFEPIRSGRQNLLIGTVFSNRADLVLDLAKVKAGGRIDQAANTEVLKKVTPEEKAADIVGRLPLLSMLNVTYLISLYPLTSSQLTMLGSFHIEKPPLDYYVYINRLVMPRVYFASKPTFLEGSDRDLFIAMMETKDFSKKTYIECADCEAPKVTTASVGVIHTENGLLEAITTSSTGGWLVYSESNLPGWIAKIDGIRVPIQTANYLFMGIQVPKGDHSIEFRYVGSFALLLDAIGFKRL